jgi:CRP-like cAMP-binding protein
MTGNSTKAEIRMDHSNSLSSPDSRSFTERAPLTRVRVSTRSLGASVPLPGGSNLLPDTRQWGQIFGGPAITAAEGAALNQAAQGRRVGAGTLVFAQGEKARALVLVADGDVALGVRGEDGSFRTERHMHGPAWLDVSAGWLGESHALDARAMSGVIVVDLPREAFVDVLDRCPGLARRLVTSLAREVRALAVNTHDLMHKDAPARLAAWLAERCTADPSVPERALVQLPMRKRDIASQLAITPETLSRLMRMFSVQGILRVAGYTVHVLDPAGLQRLAMA